MKQEILRRRSHVEQLRELFEARPLVWIDAIDLEGPGGRQAWRTRVSDLNKKLKAEGVGVIENRQLRNRALERDVQGMPTRLMLGGAVISQYRFRPARLGRDSTVPTASQNRTLFDVFPRA